MLLQPMEADQGYLKAGFLGFTAAGKTYTAMLLAVAVKRHFALPGPISMFDTEGGSQYVKGWVQEMTGKPLLGVRARSFDKLVEFTKESESSGISVAVIDSIAHPWEELKSSFLADLNESRIQKGWKGRDLEFQDWAKIKPMWATFTTLYLNSKLHLIICGRAGDIYEMEKNEETGRKELSKTGIKMQTEKNFGYEPSLLVEMSREQILEPKVHFIRRATVWKDRFGIIDGQTCDFAGAEGKDKKRREKEIEAVWSFFGQHVQQIKSGGHTPIDVDSKTQTGADEAGDDGWQREKKAREILAEEIQGELVNAIPGQTADEKKRKSNILFDAFATRSWTAISEKTDSETMRKGLRQIRVWLRPTQEWIDRFARATTGELQTLDDEIMVSKLDGEEKVAVKRARDQRKSELAPSDKQQGLLV